MKSLRQDWDYKRALEELWRRSSYERGLISDPFGDAARAERGLERMRTLLNRLGCTRAQGYFYGKPMTAESISRRLAVRQPKRTDAPTS